MRVLIAGIGNIFLGDDGFGPSVAELLGTGSWPNGVEIGDFGIRGMDLALALTSGIDAAILVDAVARGGAPGTLYMLEPDHDPAATSLETHSMDPARVLGFARSLGELPRYVRVVGCEPERLDDDGDIAPGLSAAVTAAIEPATAMVRELVATLTEATCTS